MLANATRLCEASYANLWLCEGELFRSGGCYGWGRRISLINGVRHRVPPGRTVPAMEAIRTKKPYQVCRPAHHACLSRPRSVGGQRCRGRGIRTLLAVPMFKDDDPVGVIIIFRREIRPFTDKQSSWSATLPHRQ